VGPDHPNREIQRLTVDVRRTTGFGRTQADLGRALLRGPGLLVSTRVPSRRACCGFAVVPRGRVRAEASKHVETRIVLRDPVPEIPSAVSET